MRRTAIPLLVALAALAACGSVKQNPDAAPVIDAATDIDADTTGIDAGVDAPVTAAPTPGQDITGGAGRASGPTFTMDFQLGHPTGQHQIQGSTFRLEANTPIKP